MIPIFNPKYSELIKRSDISHKGMIDKGTSGFPVATGRLGGPVWQSAPDTLSMQINHTDVFTFNDASAESRNHTNDGGGGIGRIHISFGENVFGDGTENHLSMYDGKLSVIGDGVKAEIFANMDNDAVIILITDSREIPRDITVDLTMLREAIRVWGEHRTVTELIEKNGAMLLTQKITEPCDTGISENDYYNAAALCVMAQGRETVSMASSEVGQRQSMKMTLPKKNGTFAVIIGGSASMDESIDVLKIAVSNAEASKEYFDIMKNTALWWSDFWSKSYVYLPSKLHFEKRRNYYLYLSAISNRGDFPSKYNGGIWCAEEDRRDWGSFYWNWNQDSLYQGLITANHIELMEPMFKMRERSFSNYKTAARQMFCAEGIYIPETCGTLGWEILPDDVAASVSEYYTFKTASRKDSFTELTKRRNGFLSVWNWNVFGGDSQASFVSHSLIATQETAEYFWQKYLYTRDLKDLENGYKFIKGAAELYRTYDGFRRDSDGKYHIYNTNLHEHIWAGKDCIDDLSMARGVFSAASKASELLGVDTELREKWQSCLADIAPYPLRTDEGAIHVGVTCDEDIAELVYTDKPAFAQGKRPVFILRGVHTTESPIFKMLEKYDILTLESKDQSCDGGAWDIAVNTYLHSPGYVNQVKGTLVDQNGSSRFHVDAARLGMGDDLGAILDTQYHVFTVNGIHPNRLFDQRDYYSIEGYGTFAAAIHEGLNQSVAASPDGDPVIRLFPAWPMAWDAKYKLLAKDGFTVSASLEDQKIQYAEITSQLGGICRIRNPWDSDIDIYLNGAFKETLSLCKNELFEIDTEINDTFVLVRHGVDPETYRTDKLEVKHFHIIKDDESNIIYSGDWKTDDGCHLTEENGASAEYTFTGSGFEFITPLSPLGGKIDIYIDGEYEAAVDTYSAEIKEPQSVYKKTGLSYEYGRGRFGSLAKHTLKLVKTGGKSIALSALKIITDKDLF